MKYINELIDEVLKYSSTVLGVYEPVEEGKIIEFEKSKNVILPDDYKILLRRSNGLVLMGTTILGIYDDSVAQSLGETFNFEHYEVDNKMPMNLVPFSPDGGGNHYCFDSSACDERSCDIVFWQHDYWYSADDPPEIAYNSFAEWMKEVVIDWTSKDYDYDGNEKI